MEFDPTPLRPTCRFPRGGASTQAKRLEPRDDDGEEDPRRVAQRQKQIDYGYNTDGYRNMVRLVQHDPQLKNGGVLPLEPPAASLKVSKKKWDVLSRKWRRALHMFDDVYIEGQEQSGGPTLEQVIASQRRNWLAPKFKAVDPNALFRAKIAAEKIFDVRNSPAVPKKLPVEACMKHLLRNPSYFEDVSNVVPDSASSLTRGSSSVSPTEAGIKIHVAPSPEAAMMSTCTSQVGGLQRSLSPQQPTGAVSLALALRSTSPVRSTSPLSFPLAGVSPRSPLVPPPPYASPTRI